MFLNYHHLRYFRVVARERSLTRAAQRLNVSASAVSTQLRALEEELGQALFDRRRKGLVLSEAGKVALEYAESIFTTGEELVDTLARRSPGRRRTLRIGAMATLSRNFQLEFIRPALATHEVEVVLRSGNLPELVQMLENFALDLVLSTEPVLEDDGTRLNNHLIAEYPVSLVAAKTVKVINDPFPLNLRHVPLVLPDTRSTTRAPFEALLSQAGVRPHIAAEVDDMAMLRLLAREGVGVALVPPVVVRDELEDGTLRQICEVPGLKKTFHAITLRRQFPHPLAAELIARSIDSLALPGRQHRGGQPRLQPAPVTTPGPRRGRKARRKSLA